MKWIKHMTNSRRNPKLRAILRKHGPIGFGIYWICVEIIAENLDNNLECFIKHDIDGLADEMCLERSKVKIILDDLVSSGLFTKRQGKYQNLKILEYPDEWTLKKLRSYSGVTPNQLRSNSGQKGREVKGSEEKRNEVKRSEANGVFPTLQVARTAEDIKRIAEGFAKEKRFT